MQWSGMVIQAGTHLSQDSKLTQPSPDGQPWGLLHNLAPRQGTTNSRSTSHEGKAFLSGEGNRLQRQAPVSC